MDVKSIATTSLVLALISMGGSEFLGQPLCAIIGIVGLIFGSVVLVKISKQEDKSGKYKAIFAISIGVVWILIVASILNATV